MMNILLVDDHTLVRESLRNLLMAHGFQNVDMAVNGFDALEKTRQQRPDLILMDIDMPVCDGLTATRLIKAEMPDVKIVMLTVSANDDDLFAAIKSGACGYLLKSLQARKFIALLKEVEQGEVILAPGMAVKVLTEFARQSQRPLANETVNTKKSPELTPRQVEVLTLVAQGLTYPVIGNTLHISERTVRYHMNRIIQRLHLENRTQVIAYAFQIGLASSR